MKIHLQNVHNIELEKNEEPVPTTSSSSSSKHGQTSMDGFLKPEKTPIHSYVGRLASEEDFSLNKIKTSKFIRRAALKDGYDLPKSENTLREYVIKDAREKKEEMRCKFQEKLKSGTRYSITLDEWTSIRNRRYVNINVHDTNEHYNLGLAKGSITSKRTLELVQQKLNEFGLHVSVHDSTTEQIDVVGVTTDGASVMTCFGCLVDSHHVTCYAHALHLAVQDVFYSDKKKKKTSETTQDPECGDIEAEEEIGDISDSEDELTEAEAAVSMDEEFQSEDENNDDECDVNDFNQNVKSTILKVRKVVRQIRRSPMKNDKLQDYVQKEFKKPYVLIRDNKTRWNTMLAMVKRFLKLRNCLKKLSVDFKSIKMNFSDSEIRMLQNMVEVLEPVKAAVDQLSARNINLLHADAVFKYLLEKVGGSSGLLRAAMLAAIEKRFCERRPKELLDVLNFLHNPDSIHQPQDLVVFKMESKKKIKETIAKLYELLYSNTSEDDTSAEVPWNEADESASVTDDESDEEPDAKRIKKAVEKVNESAAVPTVRETTLYQDLKIWEANKNRSDRLRKLYESLQSIQPTSVEPERAFSACGRILSKIRSRMGDALLDAIHVLKSYYLKHQE